MPQYCIKPDCSIAVRFTQSAHETDCVGLTRRSPHRITLRVCGCGSLPAHIRTSVPLSRHFVLIHVCVDHADSFLCMLRMPENCLCVDGLILYKSTRRFALRAFASLQVFAFSRCFASLHAHTCYRRKAIVGLAHPSGVQSASGMRRTYTIKKSSLPKQGRLIAVVPP